MILFINYFNLKITFFIIIYFENSAYGYDYEQNFYIYKKVIWAEFLYLKKKNWI